MNQRDGLGIPKTVTIEPQSGGGYRVCADYDRPTADDKYRTEHVYYGKTKLTDVWVTLRELFPFVEDDHQTRE